MYNISNASNVSNSGAGTTGTVSTVSNTTSSAVIDNFSSIELVLIMLIVAVVIFIIYMFMKKKKTPSGRSITFKIMDEEKKDVFDSFLILQKESGDIEFSNTVPSTITIPNLEDGRYSIKILKDGYESLNQTINLNSSMEFKAYLVESMKGNSYSETKSLIKKIPQGLSVIEIQVKTKDNLPVKNAAITIGENTIYTDNQGLCTLTLQNGEYVLTVEKNLSEKVTKHIRVEKNDKIEIILFPLLSLSVEDRDRVQQAYSMVLNAFNEIHSGYDRMIPKYMKKVAEKIVKEIEKQSSSVNFASPEEYKKAIEEYVRAAEISMPIIASGMVERRNMLLYAKLSEISPNERDEDPDELPDFEKMSISDAMRRLSDIDNTLIYEITNITIYPVAALWKSAKTLLENPNEANANIAGIILSSAEKMLKDEKVKKRLKVTIF